MPFTPPPMPLYYDEEDWRDLAEHYKSLSDGVFAKGFF
jgi:hypothetical protein